MFVVTADQIKSRTMPDALRDTVALLQTRHADSLMLPVDSNAGDELQALTASASTALAIVLELNRDGRWSIGLGLGPVRTPLPAATRQATGPAFFAAREAVTAAKRRPTRFVCAADERTGAHRAPVDDAGSLIDLLLTLRGKRTTAGWELYELMAAGMTQAAAAQRLGVSAPAVHSREAAAGIRVELAGVPAIERLLSRADRAAGGTEGDPET